MKGVLGVWLLILLMASAYASELPGDSTERGRIASNIARLPFYLGTDVNHASGKERQ
jgi:hypothetical protein